MKTQLLVIFALLLAATLANAGPSNVLNCGQLQDENETPVFKGPFYKVMKTENGATVDYSLIETTKDDSTGEVSTRVYNLQDGFDGDEDYQEYIFAVDQENERLQAVRINDEFQWARLINADGYSVNRCE